VTTRITCDDCQHWRPYKPARTVLITGIEAVIGECACPGGDLEEQQTAECSSCAQAEAMEMMR
jgi:hypothetical protein